MMRELWKHIPLVIFTLLMPGIVISYPFVVVGGFVPLASLLVLGGFALALASFHLRSPMAAPLIMNHVQRSWFSREGVFFALFFPGLVLQILLPGLRIWPCTLFFLALGLAGVVSTISIYWQSPHLSKWRLIWAFGGEMAYVASLLILLSRDWSVTVESGLYRGLLLALACKVGKDLLVSGVGLARERENLLWVFTSTLALLGGGVLLQEFWRQTGELYWGLFFILGLASVALRLQLIQRIEDSSLTVALQEARKDYMPSKYRKYFR